ncbi:MAG: hypothetical protein WD378_09695 [Egicoccus sp.]
MDATAEVAPSMGERSDATTALPVLLQVAGPSGEAVRSWVESVLGWQPVDAETALLVPPRLCVADPAGVAAGAPMRDLPTVLLVGDGDHPAEVAAAAVRARPTSTLRWPSDRDALEQAALSGLETPRAAAAGPRILRIGGAAGGVGTSTVAAALAGLYGWQGTATLLILGPAAPVTGVRDLPPGALAGAGVWTQASPLAGVPRARAVQVGVPQPAVSVVDPAVSVCVVDAGVDDDVDVLVCRADAPGLTAAGRTTAAAVVVVGSGPAARSAVQQACGPRRRVHLPRSARVARAGLQGRVPAGLPGSWLRPLVPLTRGPGGAPP